MSKMVRKMVGVLAALLMIVMVASSTAEFYSNLFVIVDITDDVVTVEDCNGMQYQFEGSEDWTVGDWMTAVMDDNGTEKVFDDKIVSTRYERPDLLYDEDSIYPMTLMIVGFEEKADLVIMVDSHGRQYTMYGIYDWMVGDIVSCKMFDNGTYLDKSDDLILQAEYSGFSVQDDSLTDANGRQVTVD